MAFHYSKSKSEDIKKFDLDGYNYSAEKSDEGKFVIR